MLKRCLQNRIIKQFEKELFDAERSGFIASITQVKASKFPGALPQVIGVEVIFNDSVTDEHIDKIKVYIEQTYKMIVDTTTFIERGLKPKIIYVEY